MPIIEAHGMTPHDDVRQGATSILLLIRLLVPAHPATGATTVVAAPEVGCDLLFQLSREAVTDNFSISAPQGR